VSITPGHTQKTYMRGNLASHVVLWIRKLAVKNLYTIHVLKYWPLAGLFNIHSKLSDPEEKKSPEGMGGNHQASGYLHFFAQVLDGHHSPHILPISGDENVSLIGGDLIPLENLDSSVAGQIIYLSNIPAMLVFS